LFINYDSTSAAAEATPEPGSMALAGLGLALVVAGRMRKR
jgi:MYXO-CTERM domain-containing protein